MRKRKFRFWNGKKMIYFGDAGIYIVMNGDVYLDDFTPNHIPLNGPNQHLLEWTGILDKNGKEIYEGDIILHHDKKGDVKMSAYELYKSWIPCYCAAGKVITVNRKGICEEAEVIGHRYEPSQKNEAKPLL